MPDPPKAAPPATATLTPVALEALEAINQTLREIGYRVKTAALVEAALVELNEQMAQPGRAVEIVRRRVPPHSVVFPP
jgi:hypothetical protein